MYLMILDESGNSRLDNPKISEQANFFVLGGIIVKEKDYHNVNEEFSKFKKSILPTSVVNLPIHAVVLNNLSKFKNNKFKGILTDEQGKEILRKLYETVAKLPIEAIAVIIDNHNLKKKYRKPENPYVLAYSFIIEKFQKIIKGRAEQDNCFGTVNISQSTTRLTSNLKQIHEEIIERGTGYVKDFSNVFKKLNIEPVNKSSCYEISDMICYAFQRAYYSWLCQNLNVTSDYESYMEVIKPICTLNIGNKLIGDVKIKIFPEPRFLSKNK